LIGISFILAFNKPPLLLVGTGAILVINYVVRELPVGVEGGIAALRQIDPAIEEAASDLGADQTTIFPDDYLAARAASVHFEYVVYVCALDDRGICSDIPHQCTLVSYHDTDLQLFG